MNDILAYEPKKEDDLYAILGCDELSSTEQINAEYKCKVLSCHPDKHPDDIDAAVKFAMLQRAKEILCCPESRSSYDKWRLSGICMSYDDWVSKNSSVKVSMHWATKAKKEPMLEEGPSTKPTLDELIEKNLSMKHNGEPSMEQEGTNAIPRDDTPENLQSVKPKLEQQANCSSVDEVFLDNPVEDESLVLSMKFYAGSVVQGLRFDEWKREENEMLRQFRNYEI